MRCQCEYCVYNKDFECNLTSIEINALGMCEACIIVSLDKGVLEKEKKRQLEELEER